MLSHKPIATTLKISTTKLATTRRKSTFKTLSSKTTISTQNINKNPFFHCEKIDPVLVAKLPKENDPNEFNGIPLCLLIGGSKLTCKDCYENCISPYKKCPKESCYCRWYN